MTEPEALRQRRQILLARLSRAVDEIRRIDRRLSRGRRPGAGAA
ncbi:hypothetical protein [Methanothrix soehngenii]